MNTVLYSAQQVPTLLYEQKVELFENLLISTNREGMDKVVDFLRNTDFYTAPASSKFHSNYKHGLMDHSLIVYLLADKYKDLILSEKQELAGEIMDDSIILISLLHDICKTCLYIPVNKWKKDSSNNWMQYPSYELNDTFPIGHGEKSVIMLQNIGLKLNPDEMLAIRYHMGFFDDTQNKQAQYSAIRMTPLVPILQMADYTASTMMESEVKF